MHTRAWSGWTAIPIEGRLALPTYNSKVVQVVRLRLQALDWNCPQHITPLHRVELARAFGTVRQRIRDLEEEVRMLRPGQSGAGKRKGAPSPEGRME
jgi:hypothetical protein